MNIKGELELMNYATKYFTGQGEMFHHYKVGTHLLPSHFFKLGKLGKKSQDAFLKEIDLVVVGNATYIVECKLRANAQSLGQLLLYQDLYKIEHQDEAPRVKLILFYKHADPLIMPTFDKYGIKTVRVA